MNSLDELGPSYSLFQADEQVEDVGFLGKLKRIAPIFMHLCLYMKKCT